MQGDTQATPVLGRIDAAVCAETLATHYMHMYTCAVLTLRGMDPGGGVSTPRASRYNSSKQSGGVARYTCGCSCDLSLARVSDLGMTTWRRKQNYFNSSKSESLVVPILFRSVGANDGYFSFYLIYLTINI